ncbi:hypothetical protein ACDX78_13710 [Virgibacillus oceani]
MTNKEVEKIKNMAGWYRLIKEARDQGLTADEVRIVLKFLKEES